MIRIDDIQEIKSMSKEMENLREEIKSKSKKLLSICEKFKDRSKGISSMSHISRRDRNTVQTIRRSIGDFRLPEKIKRSIPDLENEIYRKNQDENEINDILNEIENI